MRHLREGARRRRALRPDARCRLLGAFATVVATAALAGCQAQSPTMGGDAGESGPATAVPISTPTGPPPSFVPGGDATANKSFFDYVNERTLAENAQADSRAIVNALAQAGFAKSDMEVTYDTTSVDLAADYVIVSVKLGETCLVGQRTQGQYISEIAAPMSTGRCLIGKTQPIDW